MKVIFNGKLVPEADAVVSAFDRGFLYGDGLFETLRLYGGQPFRWAWHWDRLARGAEALGLLLPFDSALLRRLADDLVNADSMREAVLRIGISRGVGPRGYSPKGAGPPNWAMSLHPAPQLDPANSPGWRLCRSSFTVPTGETLAWAKHASRLIHVLARAEAEAKGFDDAIMLNPNGEVVETTGANIFWIEHGTVCTPPLSSGALAGVTRAVVLELCGARRIPCQERTIAVSELPVAQAIFLTQSIHGILPVSQLEHLPLPHSADVDTIRRAYAEMVLVETSSVPVGD